MVQCQWDFSNKVVKQGLRFLQEAESSPLLGVAKAGPDDDNNTGYHLLSAYYVLGVLALCSLSHNNHNLGIIVTISHRRQ